MNNLNKDNNCILKDIESLPCNSVDDLELKIKALLKLYKKVTGKGFLIPKPRSPKNYQRYVKTSISELDSII